MPQLIEINDLLFSQRRERTNWILFIAIQVQFSDFHKGNHGEFLTLVTMSTEPPQLCHGAGSSTEASHDQAANKALNILSELGLDNVVPDKKTAPSNDISKISTILSNGCNQ